MRTITLSTWLVIIFLLNVSPVSSFTYFLRDRGISKSLQATNSDTFYVSWYGNDANTGRSPVQAWRTIARVNMADFDPGSTILFEGGQTFAGSLFLDNTDCRGGTAVSPTSVGSFGNGQAIIMAGDSYGIYIQNCDHVEISDLIIKGNGLSNSRSGVEIVNTLPTDTMLDGAIIDSLEVSGFRYGIRLRALNGLSGFSGVWVTNNHVHHNIRTGISTSWDDIDPAMVGWLFERVYVANNSVNNILGDPSQTLGHTGNGIVIGNAADVTIEHNIAFNNGALNTSKGYGPIGIWAWDCKRTIIQFNESFSNKSSSAIDGGGFDLDGGCQDSIMQYNFSHDNDGAGFMVGQFPGAREMNNITVRYNLSVNDARRNHYGGIHLFTAPGTKLQEVDIYQNTVFISPGQNGAAAFGITTWFPGLNKVQIINNSFITRQGAAFIDIGQSGNDIHFWGNNYDTSEGAFVINYEGKIYRSLSRWRAETGQERLGGLNTGLDVPAGVLLSGGDSPGDYQLRDVSLLIDAGLDLFGSFGISAGPQDFFGNPAPARKTFDIGMHELSASTPLPPTPTPMPTKVPQNEYVVFIPILGSSSYSD